MGSLSIRLLGPPNIELDNQIIGTNLPKKAQALLFYLAVTGQTYDRVWIASMLWSQVPDKVALKYLRNILPALKKQLGDYLFISHQTIAFNQESSYFLDVALFENTLFDPNANMNNLRQAIEKYQGEFLAGFHITGAPFFEDWMMMERERLHMLALKGMANLVERAIKEQNWSIGLATTQRLLQLEPWSEAAHQQRMTILALTNQRGAALAQYETCRQVLADEFGVEPTSQTQKLYDRIRSGQFNRGSSSGKENRPTKRVHNLPRSLTPCWGREAELALVVSKLQEPNYPLVTLFGEGGIGKTRLALEATRQTLPHFPNGVWFVSLADIVLEEGDEQSLKNHIAYAIGDAINMQFHDMSSPLEQVIRYLHTQRALLILDNFEHLMPGVSLVIELLEQLPYLMILVTSRERLDLLAEYVVPLKGLSVPEMAEMQDRAQWMTSSSIQLFTERASRLGTGFTLDSSNIAAVIDVCKLVHGNPLAIEIAATLTKWQDCATIAAEIRQNYSVLSTTMHGVSSRHQSIHAVFEYSWQLLSPSEAQALAYCSVFQGDFSVTAVQTITNSSLTHLIALANKSLLQSKPNRRFEMHTLIRQYASAKLVQQTDTALVHEKHSLYYLNLLPQYQQQLSQGIQTTEELYADMPNIRMAWQWAIAHKEIYALGKAVEGLSILYRLAGLFYEAQNMLAQAITVFEQEPMTTPVQMLLGLLYIEQGFFVMRTIGSDKITTPSQKALRFGEELNDNLLQARAHFQLAQILVSAGKLDESQTHSEASLQFAQRDPALHREKSQALFSLGHIAEARGDYATAQDYFQQALTLAQESENRIDEGQLLDALGTIFWRQGLYDQANEYLQQGLVVVKTTGDQNIRVNILNSLGVIAWYQGLYAQAIHYYEQSLGIYQGMGIWSGQSAVLNNLGLVAWKQENYEQAVRYFEQSLQIEQDIGTRSRSGVILGNLGIIARLQGLYEQAIRYHEQSLAMAQEMGDKPSLGRALNNLGMVAINLGQFEQAIHYLEASLKIRREVNDREGEATTLVNMGVVAYIQKQYETALAYHQRSLAISKEIGDKSGEAAALTSIGITWMGMKRPSQAEMALKSAISLWQTTHEPKNLMEATTHLSHLYLVQGDHRSALTALADVMTYLENGGDFSGTEYAFQNYLISYQVLIANQDNRANAILHDAYSRLMQQSQMIENPDYQLTFFEAVSWHSAIRDAWERSG
ncbi:MAG: tetratricopeptide repeat protein [Ardenticatenaceae bacterium]|nr:tetratricopeptide repeat protein [Ardenticatenaceae bacterium]MCB8990520.1 tetratricopeptide repeat protein [Ardenticatenaceae bacterium]MCB9005674.1 tetratricopeptide repeat protein [Ardenticatenaceae bacterium]